MVTIEKDQKPPGKKNTNVPDNTGQIISYQKLRTFIGITGFFLPFVLVLGCLVLGAGRYSLQPSISHFYYSKMHIVFVCTLCVLGGFLITYKGKRYDVWESRISNLAGYCALAVASFPTAFDGFRRQANGANQYLQLIEPVTPFWCTFHFVCAGLLFVCFIVFCLKFFQRPDEKYTDPEDIRKFHRRQRLYTICGYGIAVSIVILFAFYLYKEKKHHDLWIYSTFCFETTSLLFFGTAWLIKGSEAWKKYPLLKWIIKGVR